MNVDHETLRGLERLHVRAWPALASERIDGWLWRSSGGASQRANSVSTIAFTGRDIEAAMSSIEARYRANRAPARFHTFDLTQPPDLADRLIARGYVAGEATLTMLGIAALGLVPDGVEITDHPTPEWLDVYLGAITESRRAVNRQILARVPDPRAFFSLRRDGRLISTALGVVHGAFAVVECVATRPDMRGQRGAEAAVRALLIWAASWGAHTVGLQVVANNASALALYRRLGFEAVCTNQFWVAD